MKPVFSPRAPKPIGPYSQAVVSGGFVFCSGQLPMDPAGNEVVAGGIVEQSECVFRNLDAVLREAGSGLERAVKVTVYLTDLKLFAEFNSVYAKHFPHAPARATVGVKELPRGVLVEVDVVAEK